MERYILFMEDLTLDGIRLGQLCQVGQEILGDVLPGVPVPQPQVDMCTGELVDVELFWGEDISMWKGSSTTEPCLSPRMSHLPYIYFLVYR